MSGIIGICHFDGKPVLSPELEKMLETIAHLGPDGAKLWRQGPVGLGHQMLRTTPESFHERLPLSSKDGRLTITADARIDNRDELIASLAFNNRLAAETSDSELILAAYEKWGEGCAEKLLGDFAFAIWDASQRSLFCVRDHLGIKPFYYFSSGQAFVFATQIKALLCLRDVPNQLNELKVAEYLSGKFEDRNMTLYEDVWRLPPAHCLTVNEKGIKLRSYFAFDPTRELPLRSNEEYAEQLRELFTEAVRCRSRSAFPIGSTLSGGLDSSSISCVARDLVAQTGGPRLHTFSAVFEKVPKSDESKYINKVVAQNGIVPHFLAADQIGPFHELDRVLGHLDEHIIAGNSYIHWEVCRAANEAGLRVVLDGWDGDIAVSHGLGLFTELARAKRWITLIKQTRMHATHFEDYSPWPIIWKKIETHGLHPRLRQGIRLTRRAKRAIQRRTARRVDLDGSEFRSDNVLKPEFARRIRFQERWEKLPHMRARPVLTERDSHFNRMHESLIPKILESLSAVAGAFSLELRFPFWDIRVLEFCLALPAEQKLHNGWNRIVMRRAMQGILPPEVQWRGDKANLSHSFEHCLLTHERQRLDDVIVNHPESIEDYVDITALRAAYSRLLNGTTRGSDSFAIWKSVSLALWLQHRDRSMNDY